MHPTLINNKHTCKLLPNWEINPIRSSRIDIEQPDIEFGDQILFTASHSGNYILNFNPCL
jgi:hypothetical protein